MEGEEREYYFALFIPVLFHFDNKFVLFLQFKLLKL